MMFGSFRDLAFMGAALKAAPVPPGEPWTPAEITTALWLDAADSSTITQSSGLVSQWNDKSGNGRNFIQGNSSIAPAYIQPGFNARNIVRTDGTKRIDSSLLTNLAVDNFSFFALCLPTASYSFATQATSGVGAVSGNRALFHGPSIASPDAGVGFTVATNGIAAFEHSANYAPYISAAQSTTTDFAIIDWSSTNKQITIRKNAITINTGLTSARSTTVLRLSRLFQAETGWGGFAGDLAEVIAVAGVVTTADRQRIEGYLAHKWGLTASLPGDHPYKIVGPTP